MIANLLACLLLAACPETALPAPLARATPELLARATPPSGATRRLVARATPELLARATPPSGATRVTSLFHALQVREDNVPVRRARLADRALFTALFIMARADWSERVPLLETPARKLGYCLTFVDSILVIADCGPGPRNGGAYALQFGAARQEVLIQAPHTVTEPGTLALACALFSATNARAMAVSTMNRRIIDCAHDDLSVFHAWALAWLETPAPIVQLHGFARDGRTAGSTESKDDADLVLSAGTSAAPPWLLDLSRSLAPVVPRVFVYPQDTRILGGTTNVQGCAARRHGARFLHIELSKGLREALLREPALLSAFAEALGYLRR